MKLWFKKRFWTLALFFSSALMVATNAYAVNPAVKTNAEVEALITAARLGSLSELERMLAGGANVNTIDAQGNSLLILAAREGRVEHVKLLLDRGADIGWKNSVGDSALMLAALRGDLATVNALLEKQAPLNFAGWSPLLYAAFEGRDAVFDRLLEAGADVHATSPNGSTALMLAARNGHKGIVKKLLKTDIAIDHLNDRGYSADTWAKSSGNTDIEELILAERERRGLPKRILLQIE